MVQATRLNVRRETNRLVRMLALVSGVVNDYTNFMVSHTRMYCHGTNIQTLPWLGLAASRVSS